MNNKLEIEFHYYKSRGEVADELEFTVHTMVRKLTEGGVELTSRIRLDPYWQRVVYELFYGEGCVDGTKYDMFTEPGKVNKKDNKDKP